jgi:hypothetical protein
MTNVVYYLLGIDVPAGTSPRDLELHFRGGLPWWAVVLLALVLMGIVCVLYLTERAKVNIVLRGVMALFRTAALVLLLLLICKPVLVAQFDGKRPREIVLLLDNTQSMKQQDRRLNLPDKLRVALAEGRLDPKAPVAGDGAADHVPEGTAVDPARVDVVKAVLDNPKLALLEKLQKRGPVVPMLFGYDSKSALVDFSLIHKRAVTGKDVVGKLDAGQSQTALADAVAALLQRKDADLPAAIVLVTDGRDNASKASLDEVAAECARLKVPLHIYGVGSALGGRVKVRDLFVSPTLFAEDNVTIPVRWRADGMDKGTAVVTVTVAGKTETKHVPVTPGHDQVTTFQFTLPKGRTKDGVQPDEVKATVQLQDDETLKDAASQPVRIVDGKVKVLYIEYAPRKEYHFLSTALLRDRRLDVNLWLISADPKALNAKEFVKEFPAKKDLLNKYDVVILGDVPLDKLKKPQQQMLLEYVNKNRGGLIVIAGRQHLPAEFAHEDLAKALPVEYEPKKFAADGPASPQAFQPHLTAPGARADWLSLADGLEENAKTWKELPGFFWHYPVTKLKPGATPLMVHPTAKATDQQPVPLMAMQHYGKGPVLYVGFEETWRWRFNTQDKVFGRFWGQVVLYLALPHKLGGTAGFTELSVDRSAMVLGKPGVLYARLLNKVTGDPLTLPKVEAKAEYLDSQPAQVFDIVLEAVPGREAEGEYQAVLPNSLPGRWQVKLTEPEPATMTFNVKVPPKHELDDAPMAAELLASMASASSGRFYREESLHELADAIEAKETDFTLRQEAILWGALPFIVFTGLVAAEWLLRKLTNLS